jgi:hypothetical protein
MDRLGRLAWDCRQRRTKYQRIRLAARELTTNKDMAKKWIEASGSAFGALHRWSTIGQETEGEATLQFLEQWDNIIVGATMLEAIVPICLRCRGFYFFVLHS